jgi:hypothetical protein
VGDAERAGQGLALTPRFAETGRGRLRVRQRQPRGEFVAADFEDVSERRLEVAPSLEDCRALATDHHKLVALGDDGRRYRTGRTGPSGALP